MEMVLFCQSASKSQLVNMQLIISLHPKLPNKSKSVDQIRSIPGLIPGHTARSWIFNLFDPQMKSGLDENSMELGIILNC
jgi:hypothetical protein